MKEKQLWLRLGVTISITEQEWYAINNGNANVLREVIERGDFKLDGESYIPSEENGFNLPFDVSFIF